MSRNTQTPAAPISFKTVPGRNRTQKWNKAPAYNYDGDDWGGYDEWEEPAPPPMPTQSQYGTQQLPSQQQPGMSRGRNQSFDRGDETRNFSSGTTASAFPAYEERRPSRGPASSSGRGSSDNPRSRSRPRDFTSPDQAPAPLVMRPSPASPAPNEWFPPRKSSLKGGTYETAAAAAEAKAIAESVAQQASSPIDKPLPFIRPSDIYKRIPEEMRRQSEEGSRPSLDTLQRETSPAHSALTPVAEARESRLFADTDIPSMDSGAGNASAGPSGLSIGPTSTAAQQNGHNTSPTLPQVQRFSGFGDEFLTGSLTSSRAADPINQESAAIQLPEYSVASQMTTELQHQPSSGFRSAVHQAFDQSDNSPSISRDSSQSGPGGTGVNRSDTASTAGISPIMSRVPSGATAQHRQQQRVDEQVPSIAEEPLISPTASRTASGVQAAQQIPRKPSPSHSRNVSGELPAGFEPGYRRRLDPPSTGTSPARTPGLGTTETRRLSSPMSAVPITESEGPDVIDQGAEIPEPTLHPASKVSELGGFHATTKPMPITGRGRSGTDYSMREADIADTVNSSPDTAVVQSTIAQAQRDNQKQFLETHATPTIEANPAARDAFRSQPGTPTHGSRAGSPTKGRVREIADNINSASRRNSATSTHSSKSSWSQFEKPGLSRQGTAQSRSDSETAPIDRLGVARPAFGREESFQPDIPGGWVSVAPTPALESPPVPPTLPTARDARTPQPETPIDLTPTTKKYQLQSGPVSTGPAESIPSAFDAAKTAGAQLGASLLSTVGIGHQTRDFASTQPAAPVEQPEMQPRAATGELPVPPPLTRIQSDSDAATSVASSVAPTPPVKDTPRGDMLGVAGGSGGYFNAVAPLRIRSREASPEHKQPPNHSHAFSTLSTDTRSSDMDSDRLRKEIVRSLDPMATNETPRASVDGVETTRDAPDAPHIGKGIQHGLSAASVAEATATKPESLSTRFSWENERLSGSTINKPQPAPEPASPEIKPEMAYERPRSSVLHVVNAAVSPISPQETPTIATSGLTTTMPISASAETDSLVTTVDRNQDLLLPETKLLAGESTHSLTDVAPSPISENAESISTRLPSYYLHDHEPELPEAPEKDVTNSSTMSNPPSPAQAKMNAPIPPFRNILAMKTSDERIKTYNDTRQTFANMNTGLSDWLAKMVERHPEHAGLSTSGTGFQPAPLRTQTSTFVRGHKASPSIAKLTDPFRSGGGQRSTSSGKGEGESAARPTTSGAGADGSKIDIDRVQQQMQQRGKDFMKNASVFGGKASSGAKGLFAKGKSRFAGGSVKGKSNSDYEAPMIASLPTRGAIDGTVRSGQSAAAPSPSTATPVSPLVAEPVVQNESVNDSRRVIESNTESTSSPVSPVLPAYTSDSAIPHRTMVSAEPVVPTSRNAVDQRVDWPLNDAPTPITAIQISAPHGDGTRTFDPVSAFPSTPVPVSLQSTPMPDNRTIPTTNTSEFAAKRSESPIPTPITAIPVTAPPASDPPSTSTKVATPPAGRESLTGSPFSLPRSHTPSSSRTSSRPLSQVFERLRDKTRSVSRSSTTSERNRKVEGSRSRPVSLVLNTSDLVKDGPAEKSVDQPGEFKVMSVRSTQEGVGGWEGERPFVRRSSTAPIFQGHGKRAMSMAMPMRTEAWNEPDAELPPKTPDERVGMGRLGVLPSPAPTLLTFEDAGVGFGRAGLDVAKRRTSNAQSGSVGTGRRDGWGGQDLGTVESQEGSLEREEEGMEDVERGLAWTNETKKSEETTQAQEKQRHIRRGSDLATLPSQQVSRPPTGKEKVLTAWLKEEDEDDDASSTEAPRPQGRYFIANAVPKDQQVSESPSPVFEQPRQHNRRISDLVLLPSQRQNSQPTLEMQDSQVLTPLQVSSSSDGVVEEASLGAIKRLNPVALENGSKESTPTTARVKDQDDLYETTPVAGRAPWRAANTGHERDTEQIQRGISEVASADEAAQQVRQEPVSLPPATDVSRPTTAGHFGDARSEVSAEEGEIEEEASHGSTNLQQTLSRHSSVSSLGDLGDAEKAMLAPGTAEPTLMPDEARRLVMSAQAVPAGPSPLEVEQVEQQSQEQRFANRSYPDRRSAMQNRPLSYAPTPRDQRGLIREQITIGAEQNPIPVSPVQVDIGGMSGPPTSTPPSQQHPMFRGQGRAGVPPTEYEQLRQSMATPSRTPQASVDTGEQKRRSGFFRSRKNTAEARAPSGATPTASRIGDNHGLEDLHDLDPVAVPLEPMMTEPPQSEAEQKQARRGSGIWNALSRRSSRGGTRPNSSRESRESSLAPLNSRNERPVSRQLDKVKEEPSKPKTLRKSQRATSDAIELEPKKKRFSKLGSLFGRSNTTASPENASSKVSSKQNRLSKKVPQDEGGVRRSETVQASRPDNYTTVSGSVRSYEAYEAMRRRDTPAFQENQGVRAQRPPNAQPPPEPAQMQAPADGWYGPSSRVPEQPQIQPTTSPAPLPEFRRMHSSDQRNSRHVKQVPEAFRPTQASYSEPVEPIGPPPGHEPAYRVMSPDQLAYAQGGRPPVPHRIPTGSPTVERSRHGSEVSQLSRQVSAQIESVSPAQAITFPPPGRQTPAMPNDPYAGRRQSEGPDEQRARAFSWSETPLPPQETGAQYGNPRSRMSPQALQEYSSLPQPPYQQQQSAGRAPSQAPYMPPLQGVPAQSPAVPPRAIPWEDNQPIRQSQTGPYPAPSRSFTAPIDGPYGYAPDRQQRAPPQHPAQHAHHQHQQQRPPTQQNRYYAQNQQARPGPPRRISSGPAPQDPFAPQPHHQRRPSGHQRWPSGYTGRRDDPTVGEEDLIMRGASYPGQEWAPSGLSANHSWD